MSKYSYRFDGTSFTGQKYMYKGPSSDPCRKVIQLDNTDMISNTGWGLSGNNSYIYTGNRGIFGGGATSGTAPNIPTYTIIDYITITTLGNASNYGDLSQKRAELAACSSKEYALFAGGYDGGSSIDISLIDYINISSGGLASFYGNLIYPLYFLSGCSNSTIGIFAGGRYHNENMYVNTINYTTMSSQSELSNFGYLSSTRGEYGYTNLSACSSSTRGLFIGGGTNFHETDVIDYITFSTLGDATNYGNLGQPLYWTGSFSNSTRGIIFGGTNSGSVSNLIYYVTLSTLGNTSNFGEMNISRPADGMSCGCSSDTRGVIKTNSWYNTQYIEINTTSNSSFFGNLSLNRYALASCSNCHGGLS